MAKYLWFGSYTTDGVAALRKSGATARAEQVKRFIEGSGGTVEALYWTFGSDDVVLIADMPDNATAAGAALAVAQAGQIRLRTTVLLTADEIDRAATVQTGPLPGSA
jgi:uncharacterized protein with GYD domain